MDNALTASPNLAAFLAACELLTEKLQRDGGLPLYDADDAVRGTNEDRWQDMG